MKFFKIATVILSIAVILLFADRFFCNDASCEKAAPTTTEVVENTDSDECEEKIPQNAILDTNNTDMKVLILNGSPRLGGNTDNACQLMEAGIMENMSDCTVEVVNLAEQEIAPCIACDGCRKTAQSGTCIIDDDANFILQKIDASDMVIFATPVYFMSMSSQMKLLIDRFYSVCKDFQVRETQKKIGVFSVGGHPPPAAQYDVIDDNFKLIADYLNWEMKFHITAGAHEKGEILNDEVKCKELKEVYKLF